MHDVINGMATGFAEMLNEMTDQPQATNERDPYTMNGKERLDKPWFNKSHCRDTQVVYDQALGEVKTSLFIPRPFKCACNWQAWTSCRSRSCHLHCDVRIIKVVHDSWVDDCVTCETEMQVTIDRFHMLKVFVTRIRSHIMMHPYDPHNVVCIAYNGNLVYIAGSLCN